MTSLSKVKLLIGFFLSFKCARKKVEINAAELKLGCYLFILMQDRNLLLVHRDVIDDQLIKKMRINFASKIIKFSLLFSRFYKLKCGTKSGKHSVFLIGKNGDDKLFDLSGRKVTTLVSCKNRLSEIEKAHAKFIQYYSIPIVSIDTENSRITEELIDYKDPEDMVLGDFQRQLEVVLEASTKIYQAELASKAEIKFISTQQLVVKFLKDTKNNPLAQEIVSGITNEALDDFWPIVSAHGDTHEWNMLMTKDRVFVIDWECSGEYIFGFDVIYTWLQCQRKRPHMLLVKSNSSLERKIKRFYQLIHHKFDIRNKNYYFSLICIAIYYRELTLSQDHDTWLIWCNDWLEQVKNL